MPRVGSGKFDNGRAMSQGPTSLADGHTSLADGHRLCSGGRLFGADEPAELASISESARSLRSLLQDHGYEASALLRYTGARARAGGPPTGDEFYDSTVVVHDDGGAFSLLASLFLVGSALPLRTVQTRLGEDAAARLLRLGSLVADPADPTSVLAPIQVYPLELPASASEGGPSRTILVATDWDVQSALDRRLCVMPIGIDSLQLALGLPPHATRGRRVLDVCCGSGIQALVAAAYGATDVLAIEWHERMLRPKYDGVSAHLSYMMTHPVCNITALNWV